MSLSYELVCKTATENLSRNGYLGSGSGRGWGGGCHSKTLKCLALSLGSYGYSHLMSSDIYEALDLSVL